MHRHKAHGDYWVWQGDEEDRLESLVCPVLIHPMDLQKIQKIIEAAELARGIVDKLPKCWRLNEDDKLVQDMPVVPGMEVYFWFGPSYRIELYQRTVKTIEADDWLTWVQKGPGRGRGAEDCYSTHKAAEAGGNK